jgi:transcriptional regulator with XRE-family HTH domain
MIDGLKERFVIVRKHYKLNVKDFVASLDIELTTVSSIESGKREPSKKVLLNIAIKYPISLSWIFTGKGSMFLPSSDNSISKIGEIQNTHGGVNIGNTNQVTMIPSGESPESLLRPPEDMSQGGSQQCMGHDGVRDTALDEGAGTQAGPSQRNPPSNCLLRGVP